MTSALWKILLFACAGAGNQGISGTVGTTSILATGEPTVTMQAKECTDCNQAATANSTTLPQKKGILIGFCSGRECATEREPGSKKKRTTRRWSALVGFGCKKNYSTIVSSGAPSVSESPPA